MDKIKKDDKVKSHLSLWKDDLGTVSGVIENENGEQLVHVIFPETDKHYGYQQSFNNKDLTVINNDESKISNR